MLLLHKARPILSMCVILLFVLSTANLLKILFNPSFFDFQYYYSAMQTFVHGGNPYSTSFFPFPYSPAALFIFLPFTALPLFVASRLFVALSFLCLFLSIALLLRLFHASVRSLLGIFLAALVFDFFPVKFSLISGQINTVILPLTVLFVYWYINKRPYLSGGMLACAVVLKLFPILLIPYLIIDKQWKILASMLVTLLIIAIAVFLTVPLADISLYFTKLLRIQLNAGGGTGYYDQSLSAFIARTFTLQNPISTQVARVLAGVLLISTFSVLWLFRRSTNARLLSISILFNLNIILNNFAWQHHFIWLLVPFFVTFFYVHGKNLNYWYYVILGVSYLLVASNLKIPSAVPIPIQSHVLYGALLLYVLDMQLLISQTDRPAKEKCKD